MILKKNEKKYKLSARKLKKSQLFSKFEKKKKKYKLSAGKLKEATL